MTTGEKYGPTESGLTAALVALGSTPDEVAKTLQDGGYRGHRHLGCACPVAAYLKDVTGGRDCEVGTHEAGLCVGKNLAGELIWKWVDPPRAVAEFVEAFDHGMWDELAVTS